VLIVRLKQLEHALGDGRLDHAFELASAANLRADRRGQELVTQLAVALVQRGTQHADAGRLSEASADCEKAANLAGNTPEIAQLRIAVAGATAKKLDVERIRGHQLAAAKRQIDAGQLTVGQELLSPFDGDDRAAMLSQDLAAQRALLRSALTKATAAFAADDWQGAMDHLNGLGRQFPADSELAAISAKVTQHVIGLVSDAVNSGRLDLAVLYVARLEKLGRANLELEPLRRTLTDCRRAFEFVRCADASQAGEILHRLVLLWPDAAWIGPVCARLKQAADALDEVRSGPLGLMAKMNGRFDPHETIPMPQNAGKQRRMIESPPVRVNGRVVLHVDGIGGFLVIEKGLVAAGPASSGSVPDVALLAGTDVPPITLSRTDGDYFLQSRQAVLVNEKPTTGKLLSSGDKIALSPRCRFTFRRPSAASGTAVLELTGARLARGDVRQIILLDREILIGPGAGAHVRCDSLAQAAVLQPGGVKLLLRTAEAVQIDGIATSCPAEVLPGAHVRMGPVSFAVTKE
jgi:hypothetical protein